VAINIDRVPVTLTFTTSATIAVEHQFNSWEVNGWAKTWKLKMPSFANTSASGTFYFLDPDGNELWNSGSKTQNTTTIVTGGEFPFTGGETVKLVLSAIPSGSSGTIDVDATVVLYFVK
jgi:hypothetical protein